MNNIALTANSNRQVKILSGDQAEETSKQLVCILSIVQMACQNPAA